MKILDKFKKKSQDNPNVQQPKKEEDQVYSSLAQYSQQLEDETQKNIDAIDSVHQKIRQVENSPLQQRMDRYAREAIESLAKDILGNNSKKDEYAEERNEITRFINSVYDKVEDYGNYYLNTDQKNNYNIEERRKQLFANTEHELLSELMMDISHKQILSSLVKHDIFNNIYSNGNYKYVLIQYKYNILKSKIDIPIEILFIYHISFTVRKKVLYESYDLSTRLKKIMNIYVGAEVFKPEIASDILLQSLALNVILGVVSIDYFKQQNLKPSDIEKIQDAVNSYNITLPNELPEELMQYVVEENLDDTRGPRR